MFESVSTVARALLSVSLGIGADGRVGLAELPDVVLTPLFICLADLSGKMRKVNTYKYAI
jgi:hypothetical protein